MKNKIGMVYTQFGQLIGEFTEVTDFQRADALTGYTVENPCAVQIGNKQIMLVPFLDLVKENKLTLSLDDIQFGGKVFEPVDEIRNHYTSQFGGIQLVTS